MTRCCTPQTPLSRPDDLRAAVTAAYAEAARQARAGGSACCGGGADPISANLYDDQDTRAVPSAAVAASLGCGNPTALAELRPGDTVLDLGSGGGIDVLLSARRVGPAGKAYGLDMTDEMLELARANQRDANVANVEFLKGEIEAIPLPDASVDVVISNCVINLSTDKPRVLAEAFRVLRPGGRFAVSDVVATGPVPAGLRTDLALWTGCVAGALEEGEYRALLEAAGFTDVRLERWREYSDDDVRQATGCGGRALGDGAAVRLASAFIRGRKPL